MGKKEKRGKKVKEEEFVEGEEGGGGSQGVANSQESEPVSVQIKVVRDNPEKKAAPLIGYFPSGYDPLKQEKKSGDYRAKIYRNENRNQKNPRMQVVVGVSGCGVNMVGTSYSGEAAMPQLCNYALGVFDKETGVLKMVPIAANKIFRLDPRFDESEPIEEPEDDELEDKAKVKLSRSDLKDFLSKKVIRRDEKFKMLRQAENSEMQGGLNENLDGFEINNEALDAIKSTVDATDRPPFDLEAHKLDRAYPLEKIILQGEWNHLLDIFNSLQTGSETSFENYPSFVRNRIHKLKIIKDESERKKMAAILSYINHLIQYKDKHSIDGVSSAKHHVLPSIFAHKFASKFGAPSNSRGGLPKAELLINYALVLSLFVDDFQTNPSDICKDLRMDLVKLRHHYQYLGCKFIQENRVSYATLKVPLQFPAPNPKRKRRR